MIYNSQNPTKLLAGEFLRYAVVGGIAFLADFGMLVVSQELFFKDWRCGVYVATALGFAVSCVLGIYFACTIMDRLRIVFFERPLFKCVDWFFNRAVKHKAH